MSTGINADILGSIPLLDLVSFKQTNVFMFFYNYPKL